MLSHQLAAAAPPADLYPFIYNGDATAGDLLLVTHLADYVAGQVAKCLDDMADVQLESGDVPSPIRLQTRALSLCPVHIRECSDVTRLDLPKKSVVRSRLPTRVVR
jgi:hypothetical protein